MTILTIRMVNKLKNLDLYNQIVYKFTTGLYFPTELANMVRGDQVREWVFHDIALLASAGMVKYVHSTQILKIIFE